MRATHAELPQHEKPELQTLKSLRKASENDTELEARPYRVEVQGGTMHHELG